MIAALLLPLALSGPALGDGYDFLARGKPTYARTAFRNQLRRDPDDNRSRIGLGLAELELGNPEAASRHLLEALRVEPDHAQARLTLARSMLLRARSRMALGQFDDPTRYLLLDAIDQAGRAARLAPDQAEPHVVRAQAAFEAGELDEARDAMQEAQAHGADLDDLIGLRARLLGVEALSRRDEPEVLEQSLAELAELTEQYPDSVAVRLVQAEVCQAFSRWGEALAAYQGALRIDPFQRPCLEALLAYLPYPEWQPRTAEILREASELADQRAPGNDPRPAYAMFCVGQAELLERHYDAAATRFAEALRLDEGLSLPCQLGLGEASFRNGDYDRAALAYLKVARGDSDLALLLIRQMRQQNLVASSAVFLANRAVDAGHSDDGRDLLSLVVELTPDDTATWNNYAFLCRETGQYEESYRAYTRLLELAPDQPRYLNDAALILQYHLHRDLDRARDLYRHAIDCAERLLAEGGTPEAVRLSAESALGDARRNLDKLEKN